jgi:hypothetical protein
MKSKQEVLTFKVDTSLSKLMRGITNRSEFIRSAILNELNSTCPFCRGSGVLHAKGKKHWDAFIKTHRLLDCKDCGEKMKIVCIRKNTR